MLPWKENSSTIGGRSNTSNAGGDEISELKARSKMRENQHRSSSPIINRIHHRRQASSGAVSARPRRSSLSNVRRSTSPTSRASSFDQYNSSSSKRYATRRRASDNRSKSPTSRACSFEDPQQIKRYYNHDISDELTVLQQMCHSGHREKEVRMIAKLFPDLIAHQTPVRGDTALHFAVSNEDLNTVLVLIKADPEAVCVRSNKNGFFGDRVSPLHVAISSGASTEIIQALVESSPRCIKMKDGKGVTPIQLAEEKSLGLDLQKMVSAAARGA